MNVRDVRRVRLGVASVAAIGLLVALPFSAQAAEAPVDLGTAKSFAVLAGTTVTNTGATKISGDLGLSPGKAAAITGFPPGLVTNGSKHAADALAAQAQLALTTAYDDASGRVPPTQIVAELGGLTLVGGVYKSTEDLSLSGTLTLNGQNDPNSVFIFQAARGLTVASSSHVNLINGASACNVFWQVTSSATLGSDASFRGTIMALTSISLNTRATVDGRVLARNGAVTLQANTIGNSQCVIGTATPTPPVIAAPGAPTGVTVTPGNGQAVVSWTPSVSGGAATSFTVTASPGGMSVTTTGTTATVTGLTNGTSYTFTVTATNSAGTAVSVASAAAIPAAGVVPVGAPATGDGSTSGGANDGLGLLAGVLVFAGVGGVTVVATRRRRRLT